MKLFAPLTFALFASLSAACIGAPEELDAAEVALEDVDPAASEAAGAELSSDPVAQDLACPATGTCEKANILCVEPPSPWCDILTRCIACGWPVEY